MKVYILTVDTYNKSRGSEIRLLGVFSTEWKAYQRALEMNIGHHTISILDVDDNEENSYLGGCVE